MALVDAVRSGPPRDFLVSGAYHTPNGHLHLGHLGGPFLAADVIARHLGACGHRVVTITSTDAYEAYVLLTSQLEGRLPVETARFYWQSARNVLAAFDLHYDAFIDFSADPWRRLHHEECHRVAALMRDRDRLRLAAVELPRSRSGRFALGPFALGRCPLCGADAAGTACESCGMWFGPGELREVQARFGHDPIQGTQRVPTVFLRAAEELTPELVEARFPPGYAELLERYLDHNGGELHLTHPLDWGVPWLAHDLDREIVHVSYGTGSYAATKVTGHQYRQLTGAELSPFDRASEVTTVLTGGYDAALPCMMVAALMDRESSFDPYRCHVMNRFMLLDGLKFSTSMGHVILGEEYLAARISPDLFRLYAAQLTAPDVEGDFVPAEFFAWSLEFVERRLARAAAAALRRLVAAVPPAPLEPEAQSAIARALTAQAMALALPATDISRGVALLVEWVEAGEAGLAASAPYWWLKGLAVLGYPFLPRWSSALWSALGGDGTPAVAALERASAPRPERYLPLGGLTRSQLSSLERKRSGDDG